MLVVSETRNPNALAQLEALANKVVEAMADEGALVLYEKLDASTSVRTGEKYAGLPRRSSTPTQMPQEQSGDLQRMVDSKPLGPSQYGFGLYPKTAEEIAEAKAMETGAPRANVIARAPVRRTALDSRTHQRMIARGKKEV